MPWTVIINWSHLCLLQEQGYKLSFLAVCTAPALWHTWWCLTWLHLTIPSTLNWCKTLTLGLPIDDTLFCLGIEWEIWFKVFIYVAVTSTSRPWYGLISSRKCWVTSGIGTHNLFVATRTPPALQLMWWYLALCASKYPSYLEVQFHCTLARNRPNILNFTETAYTPWVHENMSNFDIQCACPQLSFWIVDLLQCAHCTQLSFWLLICCPSSHFELFIFCNVRIPQLSFWIVNPLPCANTPSFHFELFIVCNVRMPSAFISFTMYTDYREGILARITGYTILILATATSTHRQF